MEGGFSYDDEEREQIVYGIPPETHEDINIDQSQDDRDVNELTERRNFIYSARKRFHRYSDVDGHVPPLPDFELSPGPPAQPVGPYFHHALEDIVLQVVEGRGGPIAEEAPPVRVGPPFGQTLPPVAGSPWGFRRTQMEPVAGLPAGTAASQVQAAFPTTLQTLRAIPAHPEASARPLPQHQDPELLRAFLEQQQRAQQKKKSPGSAKGRSRGSAHSGSNTPLRRTQPPGLLAQLQAASVGPGRTVLGAGTTPVGRGNTGLSRLGQSMAGASSTPHLHSTHNEGGPQSAGHRFPIGTIPVAKKSYMEPIEDDDLPLTREAEERTNTRLVQSPAPSGYGYSTPAAGVGRHGKEPPDGVEASGQRRQRASVQQDFLASLPRTSNTGRMPMASALRHGHRNRGLQYRLESVLAAEAAEAERVVLPPPDGTAASDPSVLYLRITSKRMECNVINCDAVCIKGSSAEGVALQEGQRVLAFLHESTRHSHEVEQGRTMLVGRPWYLRHDNETGVLCVYCRGKIYFPS